MNDDSKSTRPDTPAAIPRWSVTEILDTDVYTVATEVVAMLPTVNWWRVLWWSGQAVATICFGGGFAVASFSMAVSYATEADAVGYIVLGLCLAGVAIGLWAAPSPLRDTVDAFAGVIADVYKYVKHKADVD